MSERTFARSNMLAECCTSELSVCIAVRIPTTHNLNKGIEHEAWNKVNERVRPAKEASERAPAVLSVSPEEFGGRLLSVSAQLTAETCEMKFDDANGKEPAEQSDCDACKPPRHKVWSCSPDAENDERQGKECYKAKGRERMVHVYDTSVSYISLHIFTHVSSIAADFSVRDRIKRRPEQSVQAKSGRRTAKRGRQIGETIRFLHAEGR